ncbi:MAG: Hsp90 cochaperone [Phylliscum demangeonii]|nr:MAG: Hsp90 cochaperone [Phylliscum demangeonii]
MADSLKAEGNKAFAEKRFDEAVEKFSDAISLEPTNHVLYSNRSGAYASLKDFAGALEDAEKVTQIKPDWAKGWTRKGAALHGQGNLVAAMDAYEKAIELEPANAQAKAGADAVQRALDAETRAGGPDGDGSGGLGNMFNDPQLIQKLAANPKTSRLLAQPDFMAKLQRIRQNPGSIGEAMADPRFLQVMGVLLGVDMQFGQAGDEPSTTAAGEEEEEDVTMADAEVDSSKPTESRGGREQKAQPEPEPAPEPEDEAGQAAKQAKEAAEAEKKLGTECYKKRQFDDAIAHYSKAWDLHQDVTYLTNLGAAKYEKGDYQGAVDACQQAVNHGREMLADFKLIAKAFGRMGTAYEKLGDLPRAIDNYQRSLTEHRTAEVLAKLRAAEKAHAAAQKAAYVDPVQAEAAREAGNEKFKAADWPGAIAAYSEAIARAPDDARGYTNRAAAFIKLMSFPSAVQDCDDAIARDPAFVRAYLRKAQAYFAMRDYSKSLDACTAALAHDPHGAHAREIEQQQQKALQAMYSARDGETEAETLDRIQKDPEILAILQDPVMQSILQQAKSDPAALQEHMKNATIRDRIKRLMAAGVIRVGR